MAQTPNYITPQGMAALQARYHALFHEERPRIVETVSWAAGNGDRSENGDYIYGRKRLREIDRELAHLSKRMEIARVVDPAQQPDKSRVFFGATVTYVDEQDNARTVTLVGEDENDSHQGRISWNAPVGRALQGARVGDVRQLRLPSGTQEVEVVDISYPPAP